MLVSWMNEGFCEEKSEMTIEMRVTERMSDSTKEDEYERKWGWKDELATSEEMRGRLIRA